MTDLVKRAREVLEGVTEGPWVLRRPAFAVAARTLVPAMADRIEALEAKLAKAVEALEKLDVGEGWAAQIARATIAELTGGKDD